MEQKDLRKVIQANTLSGHEFRSLVYKGVHGKGGKRDTCFPFSPKDLFANVDFTRKNKTPIDIVRKYIGNNRHRDRLFCKIWSSLISLIIDGIIDSNDEFRMTFGKRNYVIHMEDTPRFYFDMLRASGKTYFSDIDLYKSSGAIKWIVFRYESGKRVVERWINPSGALRKKLVDNINNGGVSHSSSIRDWNYYIDKIAEIYYDVDKDDVRTAVYTSIKNFLLYCSMGRFRNNVDESNMFQVNRMPEERLLHHNEILREMKEYGMRIGHLFKRSNMTSDTDYIVCNFFSYREFMYGLCDKIHVKIFREPVSAVLSKDEFDVVLATQAENPNCRSIVRCSIMNDENFPSHEFFVGAGYLNFKIFGKNGPDYVNVEKMYKNKHIKERYEYASQN